MSPRIAVLIPCHNEAVAVAGVVQSFRTALPDAKIHVWDNNSTDGTAELARAAGALVGSERLQGKGHVVRRMFAEAEADIYVLVDGDGTYDAAAAPAMVARLLASRLDMVTGTRVHLESAAYRPGHVFGNVVLTGLVARLFRAELGDMLSGYRVFSRRFVKSFPALAAGFETETEFTVHALQMGMPVDEMPTNYRERPPGSESKLRTLRDGARILRLILRLVRDELPLPFFLLGGAGDHGIGIGAGRARGFGIPAHRPGAAAAHRIAGGKPGDDFVSVLSMRRHPGRRGAWPARNEAAGVFVDSRTRA